LVIDQSKPPDYQWHIAGGPAIKVDYEPTRTPPAVFELLRNQGILGKPIGIYRIVSKEPLPPDVWKGIYGTPLSKQQFDLGQGRTLFVDEFELEVAELLKRATFGAFGNVLNVHLPSSNADFWKHHIVKGMGFMPADLNNHIFYNYLEVIPHRDAAAWDTRNIRVRVKADVRRDFVSTITSTDRDGATLSFGDTDDWPEHLKESLSTPVTTALTEFASLLDRIRSAITQFERLVKTGDEEPEATFHKFLESNPILLDVYGTTKSKPKFLYPPGKTSPVGKAYVEPDFLIKFSYRAYRLVELERANKDFATQKGHPRQDFSQAAFQIGEWRNYIQNYYHLIQGDYPGINASCSTMIVMSRKGRGNFPDEAALRDYLDLLKSTVNVDDVLTYEDLLERARVAYSQMLALKM